MWNLVDLISSVELKQRPTLPLLPQIADYEATTMITLSITSALSSWIQSSIMLLQQEQSTVTTVLTRIADLTVQGQEDYKDDWEDYKIKLELYKLQEREY